MKKVYVAGKIRKTRDPLHSQWGVTDRDSYLTAEPIVLDEHWTYVGPFSIGCDHGCYHGPATHGAGREGCGDTPPSPNEIFCQCLKQICECDIFVAYIDSMDCYGTLSEIGFATSHGKPIFIVYDPKIDTEQLWFVEQFATQIFHAKSDVDGLKKIQSYLENKKPGFMLDH
jgi:hypothetical protein